MDLLAWLHLSVLEGDDVAFSSKGHDAPAVYAVLAGTGKLDFSLLHRLRRIDGLPGHPDIHAVPAVHTNTGSLGMGVSKAKGFARAARLAGRRRRAFVVTGDGELQEGQFWESLGQAANERFGEITSHVTDERVEALRPVQSDPDDPGVFGDFYELFGHGVRTACGSGRLICR